MRLKLLTSPSLFLERLSEKVRDRARVRSLRNTCAHWLGSGHIDSLELIRIAAREGACVFYDIGANVGTWTLLCRAVVGKCSIVAFEPMPQHVSAFEENTRGMEGVTLVPCALGRRTEVRSFFSATFSDASSLLPLNALGRKTWNIDNEPAQAMEVARLDDVRAAKALPAPDLIKLDVQGFELEVLAGGTETLKHARWVLSEVSFSRFYEGQVLFSELAAFLTEHGFEVAAFGDSIRRGEVLNQVDVLFRRLTVQT